jgi:uncharacterized membrane protein
LVAPTPLGHDDGGHVVALARRLLHGEFSTLSPREQRVIATIARRQPTSRDANRVLDEEATVGARVADRVARFGGSWTFILIFVAGLAGWIGVNLELASRWGTTFDAYPFIFLNLVLSMVAALQAPVILMSQNRQANRDRVSAELDYEVNLRSELEITSLHEKIDALKDAVARAVKPPAAGGSHERHVASEVMT